MNVRIKAAFAILFCDSCFVVGSKMINAVVGSRKNVCIMTAACINGLYKSGQSAEEVKAEVMEAIDELCAER